MSETAPPFSTPDVQPADQDALWAQLYTGHNPYVASAERQYLPTELTQEQLRGAFDPVVQAAYINAGIRPKMFGNRVAKVGACIDTAQEVTRAAWRAGLHAAYVENPEHTHGYLVLPTSQAEAAQIEVGQLPEDPLILDPTYAQFIDERLGGFDFFEADGPNPTQARLKVGTQKGHHTPESPYFVGRASTLKNPDSGVFQAEGYATPWDSPIVMQFE